MIKPIDIEKKHFGRSVRGYNSNEVDLFLDEIMVDYEKLIDINKNLSEQVKKLNEELDNSKKSENSVMNTLESAKHLMSDISASAEKRAEIILKNAKLDAEVIQKDAKESIGKLAEEGEDLKRKVARYRTRYRQLLENELSQLEGSSAELFAELEKDFLPASMELKKEPEVANPASTSTAEVTNTVNIPAVEAKQEENKDTQVSEKTVESKSALEMIMEDLKKAPPVDDKSKTRVIDLKDEFK